MLGWDKKKLFFVFAHTDKQFTIHVHRTCIRLCVRPQVEFPKIIYIKTRKHTHTRAHANSGYDAGSRPIRTWNLYKIASSDSHFLQYSRLIHKMYMCILQVDIDAVILRSTNIDQKCINEFESQAISYSITWPLWAIHTQSIQSLHSHFYSISFRTW